MNNDCFHSYCKLCIDQSSTSSLCPLCSQSLPSSLPINFTLSYWKSLSPSPPINLLLNNNNKNNNSNNNLNISNENNLNNSDKMMAPFISFYKCEEHKNLMRLFCDRCDQFICCTGCLDETHLGHPLISVQKLVVRVKQNWINNIENAKKNNAKYLDNIPNKENELNRQLLVTDQEIISLEEKINQLKLKKVQLNDQLNEIRSSNVKIDQASGFLRRFVESLPPLPLSSFHSFSPQIAKPIVNNDLYSIINNINNNDNKVEEEEEEEEGLVGRKRIKDFFEKDNLQLLFSLLLFPTSPNTLQQIDLLFHQHLPNPNPNSNPIPYQHPSNSQQQFEQGVPQQGGPVGFVNRFFGNQPGQQHQPPPRNPWPTNRRTCRIWRRTCRIWRTRRIRRRTCRIRTKSSTPLTTNSVFSSFTSTTIH